MAISRTAVLESQAVILDLVAGGAGIGAVLDALVRAVEGQLPPSVCAVTVQGRADERLGRPCGPGLPAGLVSALDDAVGHGDAWAVDAVREAAVAAGFGAVLTRPIRAQGGSTLGTLNLFYPSAHAVGDDDGEVLDRL